MAGQGHNSGFKADSLKSYIARVQRLEEEKAALSSDIKEVYAEAKGTGLDTKTMRKMVREQKMDKADLQEMLAQEELYRSALGVFG